MSSASDLPNSRWITRVVDYLNERKHFQTLPLSTLSDTRLGIDAAHYLNALMESPPSREPLLAATGGLPLGLTQRLESDLRVLEKLHIKPVFVFPGIPPSRKFKAPQFHQEYAQACADRQAAWDQYEHGHEEEATRLFAGKAEIKHHDLWRMILRVFRHRNVEFLVAPYLAAPQVRCAQIPDVFNANLAV